MFCFSSLQRFTSHRVSVPSISSGFGPFSLFLLSSLVPFFFFTLGKFSYEIDLRPTRYNIICYNMCPTLNRLQLFVICSFVSLLQNVKDLACTYAWCSILSALIACKCFNRKFFLDYIFGFFFFSSVQHWYWRTIYHIKNLWNFSLLSSPLFFLSLSLACI